MRSNGTRVALFVYRYEDILLTAERLTHHCRYLQMRLLPAVLLYDPLVYDFKNINCHRIAFSQIFEKRFASQSVTRRQPTAKPLSVSIPTPFASTFPFTIHETL